MAATTTSEYPVRYSVDYPQGGRNRLTTFFRLFLMIPIVVLFALLSGSVSIPTLLMLLFRREYPRWWFDWNREQSRFSARISAYIGLLRDEYPSTDEEQAVHLEIDYPDAQRLNRWLPLVKWLLAIPHYVVLMLLYVGLAFTTFIAGLVIIVTGRYPRGLWNYSVGVSRWSARVSGYAFLLMTDRYPPFSLS